MGQYGIRLHLLLNLLYLSQLVAEGGREYSINLNTKIRKIPNQIVIPCATAEMEMVLRIFLTQVDLKAVGSGQTGTSRMRAGQRGEAARTRGVRQAKRMGASSPR